VLIEWINIAYITTLILLANNMCLNNFLSLNLNAHCTLSVSSETSFEEYLAGEVKPENGIIVTLHELFLVGLLLEQTTEFGFESADTLNVKSEGGHQALHFFPFEVSLVLVVHHPEAQTGQLISEKLSAGGALE